MGSVPGSESDHGNIIIKHCNSRKRKELEDNINNQNIKCDLNVKTGSSTTQHDTLSSSNKNFKTLMTNYNTNDKLLLLAATKHPLNKKKINDTSNKILLAATKHLLNKKKINDTSNKIPRLSNLKRVQFSSAAIKDLF